MRVTLIIVLGLALLVAPWGALAAGQPEKVATPLKIGHIVYDGGNGSSMEQAVVIKNAKNEMEGVSAERTWIDKVHPGWRKRSQALLSKGNRYYDKIEYGTPEGTVTIFSDITEFFGKI